MFQKPQYNHNIKCYIQCLLIQITIALSKFEVLAIEIKEFRINEKDTTKQENHTITLAFNR